MRKIILVLFILVFIASACAGSGKKPYVVFINPGKSDEEFWVTTSIFMKAAADNLGISLDVLYAERDHIRMVDLADKVTRPGRSRIPDYLVIVNEKSAAPQMLSFSARRSVKTFLIMSDLLPFQKKECGNPREKNAMWIGTLVPDYALAGNLTARSLLKVSRKSGVRELKVLSISGTRATPSSMVREKAMLDLFRGTSSAAVLQTVYAEWDFSQGYRKTRGLLLRYPDANVIWAGNDLMAMGALKASKESGKKPGRDIFISGINWSIEALQDIESGDLVSSAGGHFMCGGWALVVLFDHFNGIDFHGAGSVINVEGFRLADKTNASVYLRDIKRRDWSSVNFRSMTKYYGNRNEYQFSVQSAMEQIKKAE